MANPSTIFPDHIPVIYSAKTQKIFDVNTVFAKLVNKDYEGEIKNAGDTVRILTVGDINVADYTRSGTLSATTLTDPYDTLVVNQEKYTRFDVDRIDKKQNVIDIIKKYSERAGVAQANTVDQHLHSQYANVDTANVIGSSSAPIVITPDNVYSYVAQMAEAMDEGNAPYSERHLVVHPKMKTAMIQSPEFIKGSALGDKTVTKGMIGEMCGFTVHVSTNLNSSGGNTPVMALTRDLITYASQITDTEYVPTAEGGFYSILKTLRVYGSKICQQHDKQGAVLWVAGT